MLGNKSHNNEFPEIKDYTASFWICRVCHIGATCSM